MDRKPRNTETIIADERNLRLLVNNTDDPIWLVDTNYTVVECNIAFRKWVSCFVGVEIGKGDDVLFNGIDKVYHDKFVMCYQLALDGKTFRTVEDMNVDGDRRYTSVNFNPVFNDDGNVIGVSCCARDITEHRKHLLRIEEQNTALREISFIESHKIRGPVATILGLEQFYNYEDLADPINREIMEGVKTVSVDLDTIIRQVVRLSDQIGV